MTIVNTVTIASDVKGFKGATPLEVYFEGGKILKVVALPNRDTPDFFLERCVSSCCLNGTV